MIKILEQVSLAPLTTFKIGGVADYLCEVHTSDDIAEAVAFAAEKKVPYVVLSGGSNILVSDQGFRGVVIMPTSKGITIIEETEQQVFLSIGPADVWDEVVSFATEHGWWGIENLSHIPGRMGAFAVQNVGAYGQEASEVVVEVEAHDTRTNEIKIFTNKQCGFYYRHSIFNTTEKGRYIILNTTIVLSKQGKPNLSYPDLAKKFAEYPNPTLREIRDAVIEIRNRKYPFPIEARGGNAGSFFQNPQLTDEQKTILDAHIREKFSEDIQLRYETEKEKFSSRKIGLKISAFLIDICGLKGTKVGGAYINDRQPLVVLNDGTATAHDVIELAKAVIHAVFQKTGIVIPIETELIGFSEKELNDTLLLKPKMV